MALDGERDWSVRVSARQWRTRVSCCWDWRVIPSVLQSCSGAVVQSFSWAVPRGLSLIEKEKEKKVQQDHPG